MGSSENLRTAFFLAIYPFLECMLSIGGIYNLSMRHFGILFIFAFCLLPFDFAFSNPCREAVEFLVRGQQYSLEFSRSSLGNIRKAELFFLGQKGRELAGSYDFLFRKSQGIFEGDGIYIERKFRGLHLGTRIAEKIFDVLQKDTGLEIKKVEIVLEDTNAQKFFQKLMEELGVWESAKREIQPLDYEPENSSPWKRAFSRFGLQNFLGLSKREKRTVLNEALKSTIAYLMFKELGYSEVTLVSLNQFVSDFIVEVHLEKVTP